MKGKVDCKIKFLTTYIALGLLITACGGGGGGGGGSNVTPTTPPNVSEFVNVITHPNKPTTPTNEKEKNKLEVDEKLETPIKPIIPKEAINIGLIEKEKAPILVGIYDNNFNNFKVPNEEKYTLTAIDDTGQGETHGVDVAKIIGKGTNFKIQALGAGKENDIIEFDGEKFDKLFNSFGNQKVKIINMSWGVNLPDEEYKTVESDNALSHILVGATKEVKEEFKKTAIDYVNNGLLAVIAAGNIDEDTNGNTLIYSNSSLEGSLPKYIPELEKGWLSVVGILEKEFYNEKEHFAYAGDAKNWSITALGEYKEIKGNEIEIETGSSFAAPRVTRAAGLVYSKFRWMDNNQVRQTLLTTTDTVDTQSFSYMKLDNDRMDESYRYLKPTADDKYGWGYLNTERALKGPGRFLTVLLKSDENNNRNGKYLFKANIPMGEFSEFANNIDGDGGLLKDGKGSLYLTGINSFTGLTIVENGELHSYKILGSDRVEIEKDGKFILHDNGVIGKLKDGVLQEDSTKVTNQGIFELDGKKGYIGGDYEAIATGVTKISDGGKLYVTGKVTLNENEKINYNSKEYIANGDRYAVIKAKEIKGSAPKVQSLGMYKGSAKIQGNELNIEFTRENAVDYLTNEEASSINVAENIEKVLTDLDIKTKTKTLSSSERILGRNIATLSASRFTTATKYMSGEIYASAQALTFAQSRDENKILANRLAELGGKSDYDWNAWVNALGARGKLQKDGYAKGKTKLSGAEFGVDKKIGDNKIGIAMSYSYGEAKFNRFAGKSKSDSVGVALYGRRDLGNNLYISGKIGETFIKSRVRRELLDENLNKIQGDIKHRDRMFSTYLEVGKEFEKFTPFIGYSYDHLRRGGFSESNATWGIKADKKNYEKNALVLGVRSEFNYDSYKFSGYISHEINIGKKDLSFEGKYVGTDVKQKFKGINLEKNSTWAGIGVSKQLTPSVQLSGNVDFLVERAKLKDSVVSVGIKYSF